MLTNIFAKHASSSLFFLIMTKTNLISAFTTKPAPISTDKVINLVGDKSVKLPVNIPLPSPFNFPASLALETKVINADDEIIKNSGVRQAVTNELSRNSANEKVVWHQVKGLIEMGPGATMSLPIGGLPSGFGMSLNGGFSANALLSYSSLKPVEALSTKDTVFFPRTAQEAATMRAGHEVEIRGRGKVQASLGVSASASTCGYDVASAGVSLSAEGKIGVAEEFALSVLSLNGKGLVRVSITRVDEKMDEMSVKIRAGVLNVLPFLPSFGEGALASMAHGASFAKASGIINGYGSTSASMSRASSTKDDLVCCYDLDLSKPAAQEAFFRLLQLTPAVVDKLMTTEENGISKVSSHETEDKVDHTKNFRALNRCIYQKTKTDAFHDGAASGSNGSQILYRDKVYVDKSDKYFKGMQELRWEGITVKDGDGSLNTYYRFVFEKHSTLPKQKEIDRFFALAHKLNIESVVTEESKLIDMHTVDKMFSSKDDIDARMESFFTKDGVLKIQDANAKTGFDAYIKANLEGVQVHEHLEDACAMLNDYRVLSDRFRARFGSDQPMKSLEESYSERFSRDIKKDVLCYRQAICFGDLIESFTAVDNSAKTRELFAALGKADFDFPEIIAAMAHISGRENLRVHELSLSGGNVRIQSKDEGEYVHPRDEALRMFGRNA